MNVLGAIGVGREEANHGACLQPALVHDLAEHRLRVGEHIPRTLPDDRILEDRRIVAGEFPRLKERGPVDAWHQFAEWEFAVIDGVEPVDLWDRCRRPHGRRLCRAGCL